MFIIVLTKKTAVQEIYIYISYVRTVQRWFHREILAFGLHGPPILIWLTIIPSLHKI